MNASLNRQLSIWMVLCAGLLSPFAALAQGLDARTAALIYPEGTRFSEEKLTTYECGENPQGSAWIQFNIRFYVFALIFIVFDVEAVFLLPWAVVFRKLGMVAFTEGLVFIVILAVACLDPKGRRRERVMHALRRDPAGGVVRRWARAHRSSDARPEEREQTQERDGRCARCWARSAHRPCALPQ